LTKSILANLPKLAKLPKVILTNKAFICSFLAGLAVALPVVLYYLLWSGRNDGSDHPARSMVYVVSSSIGSRHYARFKLSVPFKDAEQKEHLMQELPKIKHVLANSKGHPKVAQTIRKKDFNAMRKYILKVAHEVTSVPLLELGLEELSLD
jgi:hypothetical protein